MTDDEFYANHDADPRGVYLVTVYPDERTGIFTTQAAVTAWTEALADDETAVICPFVLDEPEFGNIPPGALQ
jgi:hypothetical protein